MQISRLKRENKKSSEGKKTKDRSDEKSGIPSPFRRPRTSHPWGSLLQDLPKGSGRAECVQGVSQHRLLKLKKKGNSIISIKYKKSKAERLDSIEAPEICRLRRELASHAPAPVPVPTEAAPGRRPRRLQLVLTSSNAPRPPLPHTPLRAIVYILTLRLPLFSSAVGILQSRSKLQNVRHSVLERLS